MVRRLFLSYLYETTLLVEMVVLRSIARRPQCPTLGIWIHFLDECPCLSTYPFILPGRIYEDCPQDAIPILKYPDNETTNDLILKQDLVSFTVIVRKQPLPEELPVIVALRPALLHTEMFWASSSNARVITWVKSGMSSSVIFSYFSSICIKPPKVRWVVREASSGYRTGAEPTTGETTCPAIKNMAHNQDRQQSDARLVGRLQRLVGRALLEDGHALALKLPQP